MIGLDGGTSRYRVENTIAQNLDVFQQALSNYQDRKVIICAINAAVDADDEFEIFVPWHQWSPVRFLDLLNIVVADRWPDPDRTIAKCILEMRDVTKTLESHRKWFVQLPSRTVIAQPPLEEPSLRDLDLTLGWMHKHHKFEKDWSLYVSEPYAHRPKVDAFRLVALRAQGPAQYRVVLFATSGNVLERYKLAQDDLFDARTTEQSMETEAQVFESLLSLVDFIIHELTYYIDETWRTMQELVS